MEFVGRERRGNVGALSCRSSVAQVYERSLYQVLVAAVMRHCGEAAETIPLLSRLVPPPPDGNEDEKTLPKGAHGVLSPLAASTKRPCSPPYRYSVLSTFMEQASAPLRTL